MLLHVPIVVDPQMLRQRRQTLVDQNNLRENQRRQEHDCNIGDQVLIISFKPDASEERGEGPHTISQVHVNGTVTLMLNEEVLERINIRRIKPYYPH